MHQKDNISRYGATNKITILYYYTSSRGTASLHYRERCDAENYFAGLSISLTFGQLFGDVTRLRYFSVASWRVFSSRQAEYHMQLPRDMKP